jgi:hypothetical protein
MEGFEILMEKNFSDPSYVGEIFMPYLIKSNEKFAFI